MTWSYERDNFIVILVTVGANENPLAQGLQQLLFCC